MLGEWIEMQLLLVYIPLFMSLPMRGEWIEIACASATHEEHVVSPHAGRVD